jgi:hypothetical protein
LLYPEKFAIIETVKPKVYLETSVVSYLTARPSRDLIVAAYQQITQEWWQNRVPAFDLFISQLMLNECSQGDAVASKKRLLAVQHLPLLEWSIEGKDLAGELLRQNILPQQAEADAVHISIATTNGMDYLLTWNFKHIANAVVRQKIEQVCRQAGYQFPIICTPDELLEE